MGSYYSKCRFIVSLLVAYLGWILICAELFFSISKGKAFPKYFSKENDDGSQLAMKFTKSIIFTQTKFFPNTNK
jgi:amino acid transporter